MELKQIIINNETTIDDVIEIFERDLDVQLRFYSVTDFYNNFYKFSCILFDYAHRIKSVYMPIQGYVFEDTVFLLSTLEDQLEIEINHIVIQSQFYEDIKCLCDFYEEDLKDGSLNICILDMFDFKSEIFLSTFIDIVAFIERKNLLGLSIAIQQDSFFSLEMPICIWKSLKKYISAIFTYTEIKDKEFKGFIIK